MFNRRLLIFALLVALGALVVLARLAQMQLVHGADYARDAERAMIRTRWLATARGDILDRQGRILAVDQPCYEFTMEYPALLTSWAARQIRLGSVERGLSPEQAVERVAGRLHDRHELTLMANWAQRQAKALARREGVAAEQVLPTLAERIEWTLDSAAGIAGADRAELDRQIDRIVARVWRIRLAVKMLVEEETSPHAVIGALDEATATALRGQLEHMLGAEVAPSTRRWYPYGSAGAHVIGLTGHVDVEDVGMVWRRPDAPPDGVLVPPDAPADADDPPAVGGFLADGGAWPEALEIAGLAKLEARPEGQSGHERDLLARYRSGERVGVMGVERMAEPVLRGLRGRRLLHRTGEVLDYTPAQPGRSVRLTLDIDLQQAVEREVLDVHAENGAAVVIHVPTGQVLVLASKPRYDLNGYRAEFDRLRDDKVNLPLWHRAVAMGYPPGSTVKPLVALSAADKGVLSPDQAIECRGYLHSPEAPFFRCWIYKAHNGAHGPQTMREGIKNSCNIYFYTAGELLGVEPMLKGLRRFGLGGRPGTLLPEERSGRVPTNDWMWRVQRRGFQVGDARKMAIGQGDLEATPLQIANAMAVIARDGVYMPPVLVLGSGQPDFSRRQDLRLPAQALWAVQTGMYDVVNDPHGTAHEHAWDPDGPVICGKTGTAQTWPRRVDSNGNKRIDAGDRVVLQGDMAWFSGYSPRQDPQIAFAIVLEYTHAGGGALCGPSARQLVRLCRQRGYIP